MRASFAGWRRLAAIVVVAFVGAGSGLNTSALADARVGSSTQGRDRPAERQVALRAEGHVDFGALARTQLATRRHAVATPDPRTEVSPPLRPVPTPPKRAVALRRAPSPTTTLVTGRTPGTLAFEGLTARDSRYAGNGNQLTDDAPGQALCAGNGYVLQGVNSALAVFNRAGAQLAPAVAVNAFLGLPPEIDRRTATFGPSTNDPVCLYDTQINRWVFLVTELDSDPTGGEPTGASRLTFAVSTSGDPLGTYARYSIRTDRGDSTDRRCPCFDDFPHVGTDAHGFYITTNRFPIFDAGYNGAQLYAISKTQLAANARGRADIPAIWSTDIGAIAGQPSFIVQPAAVPAGGSYPNRQYFLTTLGEGKAGPQNRIGVFALSNTKSLDNATMRVRLTHTTVRTRVYAPEARVQQKDGRTPLAQTVGERLNSLDSATAMSEVEYAGGRLWAATGTAVKDADPATTARRNGVLWFQVNPRMVDERVEGRVVRQGYVAVATNSLTHPAIGVNADGQGAMVMSMVGPTVYPSPAFIRMDRGGTDGPLRVPDFGRRPAEGVSCYATFVKSRDRGCRWGDYSAAAADSTGKVWLATEWISSGARVPLANWSTEVIRYNP